jgi:hypothetical protein
VIVAVAVAVIMVGDGRLPSEIGFSYCYFEGC